MFIQWEDVSKLGIPGLDADHKALVELVNRFFTRAQDNGAVDELGGILNELADQTMAHFRREEILLDKHNYPLLSAHAAEHDRLLAQMRHFQAPYNNGTATPQLTAETADFLSHWLLNHIQYEDVPYKPYVMTLS